MPDGRPILVTEPLTFIPPEKPVNALLRLILMNPRWTLGITVAVTAACLGLSTLLFAASAKIDSLETQLVAANLVIDTQTKAAEGIASLAQAREDFAEEAVRSAREAGKADRRAAEVYLDLPVPAPADRCEAAARLVDEAIAENRS